MSGNGHRLLAPCDYRHVDSHVQQCDGATHSRFTDLQGALHAVAVVGDGGAGEKQDAQQGAWGTRGLAVLLYHRMQLRLCWFNMVYSR
jgi:hypothetical protein